MELDEKITVGIVVAHPDDETLWAGGLVLLHPRWQWHIVTLCRGDDADRAPRFTRALARYGATGAMAALDDGPAQRPLPQARVRHTLRHLCAGHAFDLLLTHGPRGEYTTHQRHIDVSRAVRALWSDGTLAATRLALFAYEDGGRAYLPRPRAGAHWQVPLPEEIWREKYRVITDIYGFVPESWEARATPRAEAFQVVPASELTEERIP